VNFAERWTADWKALGPTLPDPDTLDSLLDAYRDPLRFYHTLQHLEECLNQLDASALADETRGEVAIALWFHDSVYDSHASDNEARSAAWAIEALRQAGHGGPTAARVQELILATRHLTAPQPGPEALMVDIDLAILGAPATRFDEYDQQIRQEYAWVPATEYREGRHRVLAGFLERPRIYSTPSFLKRFESQARINLKRAIARLEA